MADFGKINRSAAFNPTSAFPLDARSYFESYAAALAAAEQAEAVGSTNTVYHYGQKLLVYEGGACTWYTIQPGGTLKAEGSGEGGSGADGEDGFSPTVEITEIDGGHRVSITDVNGTEFFDVLDGAAGKDGSPGADGKDGYTPVKGVDYFDGEDGSPGAPGADGVTPEFSIGTVETLAPGTPASASVTGTAEKPILNLGIPRGATGASGDGSGSGLVITNTAAVGQTVKITAIDADGKPTEWEAVDFPAAIVDVVELPTENIDEDVFYRVVSGKFIWDGATWSDFSIRCVEQLPEVGEALTNDMQTAVFYYAIADGGVYGYITEALSQATGIPVGWLPAEALAPAFGLAYGGVVKDIAEASAPETLYALIEYVLWQYKETWQPLKSIGWAGTGNAAEVFNTVANAASGNYSHAEGYNTTASGAQSHAEGYNTTASGAQSHAEGNATSASGFASHAEGGTTIAASEHQHVQGRMNIVDEDNKYAHIVGNGNSAKGYSNAHTLDWGGNAWFAGDVYVGSTSGTNRDEGSKKLVKSDDVYSKPEIDAIMGSYINDIAAIIGGDA